MPIYVEIRIRAPMDRLWEYTQTPDFHARWDLRFSTIEALPHSDLATPPQFLFSRRFWPGLVIRGKGELVGNRDGADGARTTALHFWSDSPLSPIREGSGYWQYTPTADGVRFSTQYNYETRFGAAGVLIDRLVFRPLLGWATAWSVDCLRLWLEQGIAPEVSWAMSSAHALARITLACLWIYQGLVPKLLFRDQGEVAMLQKAHAFAGHENLLLSMIGLGEMAFGAGLLFLWHSRGMLRLNNWALLFLGLGALVSQPRTFVAPFNPLTFNLAMAALGAVGLICSRDLPSAKNCLRKRAVKTP